MRDRIVLAFLVAAAPASLVACGGGKPSAIEQWQGSLCSAVDDLVVQSEQSAQDVRSQLQSPSTATVSEISTILDTERKAAEQTVTELKTLGPPPGQNGGKAKDLVDTLAAEIEQMVTQVKQEAQTISSVSSLSEIVASLGTMADQVATGTSQARSTIESLQALGKEYKNGFETVDSCKSLRKHLG